MVNQAFKGLNLYVEDNPCTYWAGIIYKNTFYPIEKGGTGYDPQYKKYEVGTIPMLKMIEDLCNGAHVQYLDFGYKAIAYKRHFCDIHWEEAHFRIFQPTLKDIILKH